MNAKTFLEKRYSEDMELEDAIHTALLTLKEGFEGVWSLWLCVLTTRRKQLRVCRFSATLTELASGRERK